jgi:FtsH-binding integral membrane protein
MSSIFNTKSPISEQTKSHLVRVYALLTAGVVVACIASLIDMNFLHCGGIWSALVGVVLFSGARLTPITKDDKLAVYLFLGAAAAEGMSLSPILHTALRYYPTALSEAALISMAVFGSFSVAAIYAKRRQFFYLSAIVGTISCVILFGSIANIILQTKILFQVQLYAGLAVFMFYVLIDTQVMIDRFESGQNRGNFVRPACDLFCDLLGIFIRLLIILMRKSDEVKRGARRVSGASYSPNRRRS